MTELSNIQRLNGKARRSSEGTRSNIVAISYNFPLYFYHLAPSLLSIEPESRSLCRILFLATYRRSVSPSL